MEYIDQNHRQRKHTNELKKQTFLHQEEYYDIHHKSVNRILIKVDRLFETRGIFSPSI